MTHILAALALCLQVQAAPKDPTEADVTAVAKAIEDGIRAGKTNILDSKADVDAFAERAFGECFAVDKNKRDFFAGFKSGYNMEAIAKAIPADGYKLLRVRTVGGKPRALFRMITPEGALNYHEYHFTISPDGRTRFSDIYVYMTGEDLSLTIRNLTAGQLANLGDPRKIAELETLGKRMRRFNQLAAAGEHKKVLEEFEALPAEDKKKKIFLLRNCASAMQLEDEAVYLKAIDLMEKTFPGDASMLLVSLDGFFLRKQNDKGIDALAALDKALGGDPYLDIMKANFHIQADRLDKAKAGLQKAVKDEPTLQQGWWALIEVCMTLKDFAEIARALTVLERDLKVELADLAAAEFYAPFVKSPEYAPWMKSRGK